MKKLLVVLATIALAACGGNEATIQADKEQRPDWVRKGQGAFPGEKNKIFAAGSASNIKNESLLQQTADNRARKGVADVLRVYIAGLGKDYTASASSGDKVSEEQYVENVQKTITEQVLAGSMIVDRWVNDEGTMYSLAILDLAAFQDAADKANTLDDRMKEHIKANATKALGDLDAELEKRKAE